MTSFGLPLDESPAQAAALDRLTTEAMDLCWSYGYWSCTQILWYGGFASDSSRDGSLGNARQHCRWNAMMQADYFNTGNKGIHVAQKHEQTGGNPLAHKRMDMHNNKRGYSTGNSYRFDTAGASARCDRSGAIFSSQGIAYVCYYLVYIRR